MSQLSITLFFIAIIGAVAIASFIHSWLDKGRIRKGLDGLSKKISGEVIQANIQSYPRFRGEFEGRQFDLFFEVVKVGRKFILYYIYSLKSDVSCKLLLLRSDAYKPVQKEAEAMDEAGRLLPEMDPNYQLRSDNEVEARAIFKNAGLKERLPLLNEFTSLQLGPDALVVGKPYDGLSDTEPEHVVRNVRALANLAQAMEQCQLAA